LVKESRNLNPIQRFCGQSSRGHPFRRDREDEWLGDDEDGFDESRRRSVCSAPSRR
jgi:hypothetical protein